MSTTYYVKSVTQCSHCKGTGIVQHPQWQQFWKEHAATLEDIQQILDPAASNEAWDKLMAQHFPDWEQVPEEIPCIECEGEREITKWVPLEEALEELGILDADDLDRIEALRS